MSCNLAFVLSIAGKRVLFLFFTMHRGKAGRVCSRTAIWHLFHRLQVKLRFCAIQIPLSLKSWIPTFFRGKKISQYWQISFGAHLRRFASIEFAHYAVACLSARSVALWLVARQRQVDRKHIERRAIGACRSRVDCRRQGRVSHCNSRNGNCCGAQCWRQACSTNVVLSVDSSNVSNKAKRRVGNNCGEHKRDRGNCDIVLANAAKLVYANATARCATRRVESNSRSFVRMVQASAASPIVART